MPASLASTDLASMALLGALGVGHCLGMCGPLVLAFPGRMTGLSPHLWYHAGRIGSYSMLGVLMGLLGGLLAHLGAVARLQILLSGFASLFLLAFGLARIGLLPEPGLLRVPSPALSKGLHKAQALAHEAGAIGMFPLGVLNGLLPCGLSYAALVRALPAGGPVEGGALLLAFGLGTVPGLVLLGSLASGFFRRHRKLSDLLAGMLMIGMAVDLGAAVLQALA